MTHLPDPITQSAFYENVPAKRLFAWVLDEVIHLGYLPYCAAVCRLLRHLLLATDVAVGWLCLPYNYYRKRIRHMAYEACIDRVAQSHRRAP